jgi:hypothetical protein
LIVAGLGFRRRRQLWIFDERITRTARHKRAFFDDTVEASITPACGSGYAVAAHDHAARVAKPMAAKNGFEHMVNPARDLCQKSRASGTASHTARDLAPVAAGVHGRALHVSDADRRIHGTPENVAASGVQRRRTHEAGG